MTLTGGATSSGLQPFWIRTEEYSSAPPSPSPPVAASPPPNLRFWAGHNTTAGHSSSPRLEHATGPAQGIHRRSAARYTTSGRRQPGTSLRSAAAQEQSCPTTVGIGSR
ncbi:hypothetical protein ZWY2020_034752 [Hordeum vulgare]|nr:hypothetical protein ZWY2020_034752 [Hordeum vulgare]